MKSLAVDIALCALATGTGLIKPVRQRLCSKSFRVLRKAM